MFNSSIEVLKVDNNFVKAIRLKTKPPYEVEEVIEANYTPDTLSIFLDQNKNFFKSKNIRILLGDELAYVVSLSIPKADCHNREKVRINLKKYIPEVIDKITWDYKIIPNLVFDEMSETKVVVQVIAANAVLLDSIIKSIKLINLQIDAIEPVSVAIARVLQNESYPLAVLHIDKSVTRCLVYQGLVMVSQVVGTEKLGEGLPQIFNFVQKHFGLNPKTLILSGNLTGIDPAKLTFNQLIVLQRDIDPIKSLASKADLIGQDESVLNLDLIHLKSDLQSLPSSTISTIVNQSDTPVVRPMISRSKMPMFITFISFLLGFMGAIVLGVISLNIDLKHLNSRFFTKPAMPTPTQDTQASATPTPMPLLDRQELKIKVLNGSGIPGVASEVADYLKELGYTQIETGNAQSFEFQKISISIKDSQKDYFNLLSNDLKKEYSIHEESGESLPENDQNDAVVIVGNKELIPSD